MIDAARFEEDKSFPMLRVSESWRYEFWSKIFDSVKNRRQLLKVEGVLSEEEKLKMQKEVLLFYCWESKAWPGKMFCIIGKAEKQGWKRILKVLVSRSITALQSASKLCHMLIHRGVVLAIFLVELRAMAELRLKRAIRNVVLTIPVSFSRFQITRVERACAMAGLHVLRLMPEPTAVALLYAQQQLKLLHDTMGSGVEKLALIFNLGAGYCDVAVTATAGGVSEIKALSGAAIGGEDILQNMMRYLLPEVESLLLNHGVNDIKPMSLLRVATQDAIHNLSSQDAVHFDVDLGNGVKVYKVVTRQEFEEVNKKVFEKCEALVVQCLHDAKVELGNLSDVILVGGCSNIPKVQDIVLGVCRKGTFYAGINPYEGAVCGAGLEGAIASGINDPTGNLDLLTIQVTPLNIGIRADGNEVVPIIHRNTTMPARREFHFTTTHDNQTEALIIIYEGEEDKLEKNHLLGYFKVGIPPAPKGTPEINVFLDIDASNVLWSLAEQLFDDENLLVRIDRAEYMEQHSVARLMEQHSVPPEFPPNATLQFDVELLSWSGVKDICKDGHFCPALAKAVKTMKMGEKVLLTVKPASADAGAILPNATLLIELELMSWKTVTEVTDDKKVLKKTLKEGEGYEHPNVGPVVRLMLVGKLEDGTMFVKKGPDEGDSLFEFKTDDEHVSDGLDKAVMKMKKGEVVLVTIAPEYGFGSVETKQDLAIVPPHSTLLYEVELVSFDKEKESWDMNTEEKIQSATQKKEEGDALFKAGQYVRASKRYEKAAKYTEYDTSFSEEEKTHAKALKVSCNRNNAACKLILKEYTQAEKLCTKVLELESTNMKVLYRRAQAYISLEDLDIADLDIKKALELGHDNSDVKLEYKVLKEKMREYNKKQAQFYGNMFAKWNKLDEKVYDSEESKLSVLIYHGGNRTKDPVELAKFDVVLTTLEIMVVYLFSQPRPPEDTNLVDKVFEEGKMCCRNSVFYVF